MIRAALAFVVALGADAPVAAAQESATSAPGAVMRGLDKVNGETVDVEIRSGGSAELFGLVVELADCRYPTDNPTGDAFAYVSVRETGDVVPGFEGWMIASSPALNALDHNRYDVWVLRCITS